MINNRLVNIQTIELFLIFVALLHILDEGFLANSIRTNYEMLS